AVQSAADQQKPLIIDIYAPWCGWCTRLQNDVYMSEPIQAYLDEHFVTTRLDIDAKDTSYQFREYNLTSPELAGGLGAQGTPTTVFLTAEAEYITRIPGYVDAEAFLNILEFIGTESFKSQTYEEFVEAKDGE
ncbi:MAG: thioredoxin fold domain-containing protein, partial [Bacteroidota bacterium]